MQCGKYLTNPSQEGYVFKRKTLTFFLYIFARQDGSKMNQLLKGPSNFGPTRIVKYWLSLPVSKRPRYNKSYDTLVTHHKYPLVVARLHFFRYIASILKALLVRFQTDRPMVPFLSKELDAIIRRLLSLFIKKKVITEGGTPHAIMKIDIQKKENRLLLNQLELGSATKSELAKTNVSEDVESKFKNECTVNLVKLIEKIKVRSPLKYSIVRYAECFNPTEMVNCAESCILKIIPSYPGFI